VGEKLFQRVHGYLERQGIKIGTGTIVDATIISASPSTKNKDKRRDPEMRQTKKGNQWYFGMKAHIGVDSQTKVILAANPANVHDSMCLPDLRCFCGNALGRFIYLAIFINTINKIKTDLRS
jgi:transposase, IS5 family